MKTRDMHGKSAQHAVILLHKGSVSSLLHATTKQIQSILIPKLMKYCTTVMGLNV